MKKFQPAVFLASVGAVTGAIIGEFFPKLLSSGFINSIGNAVSKPFSEYRNEMALKYALIGIASGAIIGIVIVLMKKK